MSNIDAACVLFRLEKDGHMSPAKIAEVEQLPEARVVGALNLLKAIDKVQDCGDGTWDVA